MPNVLDADGLSVMTRDEVLTYLTDQFKLIYGADINLESDTPDGQWLAITTQLTTDLLDLLVQVYNSFNPDYAVGNVLDQRAAINGVQRLPGTYTITPVTVTAAQSLNLYGLDGLIPGQARDDGEDVYTVSDNAGNRYMLEETQLGVTVGAHSYSFQAEFPGANLTVPNTITVPVTIVLGVTSVNNPSSYTTLGTNEESDANLRVRRAQSVSLASQGYLAGLYAALNNITGMTSAYVYENKTDSVDSDGVPGHTIWVIVAGTADDADIAQAIYTKRNAGCGLYGSEAYTVTQVDGTTFIVNWDEVITKNLFVRFTALSVDGVVSPNVEAIREGLPAVFVPTVFGEVDVTELGTYVQSIDDNTYILDAGFSDGSTQTITLSGVAASGTFKIAYNGSETAALNWNDSAATIETAVKGLPGLSDIETTGTPVSGPLAFDLSAVGEIEGLLSITSSTLATSAPAAITFTYDADYSATLQPLSKQFQFVVSEANIIITAMQLLPLTSAVGSTDPVSFFGYGGYGDYVYSIQTNNSGATIDASTGEYEAGAGTGTDTIKVTDAFGNTATATVVVS